MELGVIFKALFSLGIVFSIMYIILRVVQKYTKFGAGHKAYGKTSSLKIENIVYIDEGTKIVSISNKAGFNYIIAVSKSNSFLIDKYAANKEE
ncbi:MAG: hypothetical protein Tsb006_7380 [Rickettsiaceae bacterium]